MRDIRPPEVALFELPIFGGNDFDSVSESDVAEVVLLLSLADLDVVDVQLKRSFDDFSFGGDGVGESM